MANNSEDSMAEAVNAYIARYNAGDLDGLMALFAEDASVEDPVGAAPKLGLDAVREFFAVGIGAGARLTLDGPVRCASNYAAFPFHVELEWDGAKTRIDVIDVFQFNDAGKIAEMRAFFGEDNSSSELSSSYRDTEQGA